MAAGAELILRGPSMISTQFHGEDREQNLPSTSRFVVSQGDSRGTTIQWSAGPFVHQRDPRFVVDSRLQIATTVARNASVALLVPRDETHLIHGDRVATVSAAVINPGITGIELQVSFLAADASRLASGVYSARVVGTITSH